MRSQRLTTIVSLIVVIIWAISMIVNMFYSKYQPPVGIYPALMLVLGGLFGFRLVKGNGDNLQ